MLMRQVYLLLITTSVMLMAWPNTGRAQGPYTLDSLALQTTLDSIYTAPSENWVAGIVATMRHDGQLWEGATGLADIDSLTPMTTDYHFRFYSATKSFTAAAVLEQVVQGNWSLDDHLGQHLTTITNPNIDTTVTLRQLLTHQTGFPDYTNDEDVALTVILDGLNGDFVYDPLEIVNDTDYVDPPLFAPGTDADYSSTNYILLGLALETLPGIDSAEQYFRTELLDPAGMNETAFYPAETITGDVPEPHDELTQYGLEAFFPNYVVAGTIQEVPVPLEGVGSIAWTTGGLVGTARDLSLWAQEFYGGNIVSQAALDSVLASRTVPGMPSNFPGYGIFNEPNIGDNVAGHGGAAPGYRSNMVYDFNNDIAIGICTNQGEGSLSRVANALLNVVLNKTTDRADATEQANWNVQLQAPYPNPARHHLTIELAVQQPEAATIAIFDGLGRTLHTEQLSANALRGEHRLAVDVLDYATGTYFIRLTTPTTTQVQRFVVQ